MDTQKIIAQWPQSVDTAHKTTGQKTVIYYYQQTHHPQSVLYVKEIIWLHQINANTSQKKENATTISTQ